MNLTTFLERNGYTRKVFGKRELKIIEKQLAGISLTQSEKNRLSRDIRPKFNFIEKCSHFKDDFKLKKGMYVKDLIKEAIKEILNHEFRSRIAEIWLFGSAFTKELTFRSDIDIVVLFEEINLKEATKFRIRVHGNLPDKVDIQVFNILPKKIKDSILKKHQVLYKKNGR